MAVFHFKSDEAFLELIDIKASYDDLLELVPSDDPSRRFLQMIGEKFDRFFSDGICRSGRSQGAGVMSRDLDLLKRQAEALVNTLKPRVRSAPSEKLLLVYERALHRCNRRWQKWLLED